MTPYSYKESVQLAQDALTTFDPEIVAAAVDRVGMMSGRTDIDNDQSAWIDQIRLKAQELAEDWETVDMTDEESLVASEHQDW